MTKRLRSETHPNVIDSGVPVLNGIHHFSSRYIDVFLQVNNFFREILSDACL